ncbi:MAG: hypothetical protein HGA96_03785 [Desulfobulbaceae bacterium]|nr:hypothetical protein [Desulfobulbaceae bacterium]
MWDTVAAIWDTVKAFFLFFTPVVDFIVETKVPEQLENIQYKELFSNGWFLVPYLAWIAWNIYRRQINSLITILLLTGSWVFFGTPYMQNVMNQETIQLDTIIPLVGGACLVLGIIIYIYFFKSE